MFTAVAINSFESGGRLPIHGWSVLDHRTFSGTNLLLRCIEDRQGAGLVYEVVVQSDDLKRELIAFARGVSVACKAAGIESPDLDELRSHLPS